MLLAAVALPGYAHAQAIRLPVKLHVQEHSLSCEIATLKMALSVHGLIVSENDLISRLAFDPTPKGTGVWGDPSKGFVGSIDGRMLVTGYGVYAPPIAQVGNAYASAELLRNGSAGQLARHIAAGNPVIIWGHYGQRLNVFGWHTREGTPVRAVDGEHTRLVYGFDGPVQSPTRFYLVDPVTGAFSWSTDELMRNWSSLDYIGVVVSPQRQWVREAGDTQIWEIDTKRATRRWITSWQAFVHRGGSAAAVAPITRAKLLQYTLGSPIN